MNVLHCGLHDGCRGWETLYVMAFSLVNIRTFLFLLKIRAHSPKAGIEFTKFKGSDNKTKGANEAVFRLFATICQKRIGDDYRFSSIIFLSR